MGPYFAKQGLIALAATLRGDENIFIGIRPRGIHAGNKIPTIVYPYLLSKLVEQRGITPRFTINYFLNDYEQYTLLGPDKKKYPFNVLPDGQTLQFAPYDETRSQADYWCPIIQKEVENTLGKEIPTLNLVFIRNSSLKDEPIFKEVVIKTINEPEKLRNLFYKYSGKEIILKPSSYCMAICKKCQHPAHETKVINKETIYYKCHRSECGFEENASYSNLHFWLYHKPLAIPRIKLKEIDLCITGMDHFNEGDFIIRQKLFDFYGIKVKPFKTLYAPILIGTDGKLKMSKSKNNYYDMDFNKLLDLVKNTTEHIIYNKS